MKGPITLIISVGLIVAMSSGAVAQTHAGSEPKFATARIQFDLKEKSASKLGTFRVDGGYGVFVQGLNRLRQQVTVSVAGKDVFLEPVGPFKAPANTPKEGEPAGGEASFQSVNDIDTAISNLELLRDRGLRVIDLAYAIESPGPADYSVLKTAVEAVQTDLKELAGLNKGFTTDPRTSVAYRSAIRQIFVIVGSLEASEAKTALLAKSQDYESFSGRVAQAFDMILDEKLHYLSFGPYQATNDVVTVTVKTREINRAGDVSDEEIPFTYDVRVNDGFKIDFSAGLLYTKLEDHSFRAVAQGTAPEKYKVVGSKQGGTIQTATFVHFRGLFGGSQDFGLSLGMALEERPYYALGLSFHSSSTRQRMVLTAGVALRSVTRYEGPQIINSTEFQTTSKMKSSAFIALSYNFSS